MAFNLTEPTLADTNWAAALGFIRENFRAIVQGDDNVFTSAATLTLRIRATGAATNAVFSAFAGNGTTSNRNAFVQLVANETAIQEWYAGMVGAKDYLIRNNTAARNDLTIDTSGNAAFGGAPILARLRVGIGGTGTPEEKIVLDSGSGSGSHCWFAFHRNSVEEGSIGIAGSAGAGISGSAANDMWLRASTGSNIIIGKDSGAADLTITNLRNVLLGSAAVATTATDGFLHIVTCAGTPTGTPNLATGRVPIVFDTTGVKLWIYTGGTWKGVVVA